MLVARPPCGRRVGGDADRFAVDGAIRLVPRGAFGSAVPITDDIERIVSKAPGELDVGHGPHRGVHTERGQRALLALTPISASRFGVVGTSFDRSSSLPVRSVARHLVVQRKTATDFAGRHSTSR